MVLGHIILQAEHTSGIHFLIRIRLGRDNTNLLMFGGSVQIEEAQILHEHRRTFEQRSVSVNHETAAIEHQIILTTHLIEVDHRRVHFSRTAYRKIESSIGLTLLIRRTVHGKQQINLPFGKFCHRTAILPDILANSHTNTCAIHIKYHGFITRTENAEFVKHTVVGQEVLVIAGPNHAIMQYNKSVARLGCLAISTDRANHHKQVAKSIGSQFSSKPVGFVPRGFAEGSPQREIFNRIASKRHFRKNHDLRIVVGCKVRIMHDLVCVGVKISHTSIDLGEGEANVCHSCLVYCDLRIKHANGTHVARKTTYVPMGAAFISVCRRIERNPTGLREFVQHGKCRIGIEFHARLQGFVQSHKIRAMPIRTSFLAIGSDKGEHGQCDFGVFAEVLPCH